ncbi:FAD-dependent oxidoreductase [Epidermidibacterium keratini]|uniref:FAD-dependent oxidoreductase n=1 Tax=Epidermidibacterium keratini TaxID=1891644 RepID=A0A7L4YPX3_9ACTN|nr:FAD-dependent oxidoreductase [Epidermidibacterium keratini]QHC01072.1 FAD-dependent oxidoreductase [Epidermidibacterium keratini]
MSGYLGDSVNVAVLGSGVAGASTAYALARRGARVSIIDEPRTGQATAAGAGIIAPWTSAVDGPFYELYAAGAGHYPRLVDELADRDIAIGYRRSGALVVADDDTTLDEVSARASARADAAPEMGEIARVSAEETSAMFPPLRRDLAGIFVSGGARVDGRLLRAGLLQAAIESGAEVRHGLARIARDGAGVAVDLGDDIERYDAVVVAAGAWSNAVLADLGFDLPLAPQRGQIVHLSLPGATTTHWPSVLPVASHYLVCFDGSRVVAGATRETGSGFDPRVTAAGQREVIDNALSIAPGLADATVLETRVGLRPVSADGVPYLGRLGDLPVWVNVGFGAAGLTMGPYVGDQLAIGVLGGAMSPLMSTASPSRIN